MNYDIRNLQDVRMSMPTCDASSTGPIGISALNDALNASPDLQEEPFPIPQKEPAVSDNSLLKLIRSSESVQCFGGYLFHRNNPLYGHVICFAVDNMSKEDVINADKWYNLFGRMSHLGMLHRTPSAPLKAGNYTVFEFVASPSDKSIRSLLLANEPMRINYEMLIADLIKFIYNYSQELRQHNYATYLPLCCLSKDTVLIDSNGHMKVLPLRVNRNMYPIEVPHEVSINEYADERSDLFSAAYLAVEVYSKNRGSDKLLEPDSDIIRNCLKAIHDWRPGLNEVYAAVCSGVPMKNRTRLQGNPSGTGPVKAAAHKVPIKKFVNKIRDMVKPYELEEGESEFQRDGTIHTGAAQQESYIDMGNDSPDSTFGPASR